MKKLLVMLLAASIVFPAADAALARPRGSGGRLAQTARQVQKELKSQQLSDAAWAEQSKKDLEAAMETWSGYLAEYPDLQKQFNEAGKLEDATESWNTKWGVLRDLAKAKFGEVKDAPASGEKEAQYAFSAEEINELGKDEVLAQVLGMSKTQFEHLAGISYTDRAKLAMLPSDLQKTVLGMDAKTRAKKRAEAIANVQASEEWTSMTADEQEQVISRWNEYTTADVNDENGLAYALDTYNKGRNDTILANLAAAEAEWRTQKGKSDELDKEFISMYTKIQALGLQWLDLKTGKNYGNPSQIANGVINEVQIHTAENYGNGIKLTTGYETTQSVGTESEPKDIIAMDTNPNDVIKLENLSNGAITYSYFAGTAEQNYMDEKLIINVKPGVYGRMSLGMNALYGISGKSDESKVAGNIMYVNGKGLTYTVSHEELGPRTTVAQFLGSNDAHMRNIRIIYADLKEVGQFGFTGSELEIGQGNPFSSTFEATVYTNVPSTTTDPTDPDPVTPIDLTPIVDPGTPLNEAPTEILDVEVPLWDGTGDWMIPLGSLPLTGEGNLIALLCLGLAVSVITAGASAMALRRRHNA